MKYYAEQSSNRKQESLGKKVERIEELMERFVEKNEKTSKKKFKMPKKIAKGIKKKVKKGGLVVFVIRTNGEIIPKLLESKYDLIELKDNGTFHLAGANYMFRYNGYPALILPEYSLEPLNPKDLYMNIVNQQKESWHEKVLLKIMELSEIKKSKGMAGAGKWILFAIIGIAIFYAISELLK